jgi:hypothetical protein
MAGVKVQPSATYSAECVRRGSSSACSPRRCLSERISDPRLDVLARAMFWRISDLRRCVPVILASTNQRYMDLGVPVDDLRFGGRYACAYTQFRPSIALGQALTESVPSSVLTRSDFS